MSKITKKNKSRKLWKMKGCSSKKMRGGCGECLGGKAMMGGGSRRRKIGGCGPFTPMCAAAAPLLLLGGKRRRKKSCGCNKIPFFTGGNASALVGAPITATSPGNYYALNPEINNPNNPSVIMANRYNSSVPSHSIFGIKGGKRGRKSRKNKKGGGFSIIPQDLVNLGRMFSFNAGSSYNAMHGYKPPVNPLPYKDQMPRTFGNR